MPVENINVLIKIKTGSNSTTEIIHAATDPDNLTKPPMTFHSVCVCDNLIYTIKNVKTVETMLATLLDLFSAFQATENSLKLCDSH
ncbi:MAG: hypothetical protein ACXADY_09775 [Candidatus Hodarchaeales archaeon]